MTHLTKDRCARSKEFGLTSLAVESALARPLTGNAPNPALFAQPSFGSLSTVSAMPPVTHSSDPSSSSSVSAGEAVAQSLDLVAPVSNRCRFREAPTSSKPPYLCNYLLVAAVLCRLSDPCSSSSSVRAVRSPALSTPAGFVSLVSSVRTLAQSLDLAMRFRTAAYFTRHGIPRFHNYCWHLEPRFRLPLRCR